MRLVSTFILVFFGLVSLGQISFSYNHRHMVRSSSNPYSKSVNIQLSDQLLKYNISERGEETNSPRSGEIQLSKEQIQKIESFLKSKGLTSNHREAMSGDTGKFDAYNLSLKNGDESYSVSLSLGAEDQSDYKAILEEFEALLNSFIPKK